MAGHAGARRYGRRAVLALAAGSGGLLAGACAAPPAPADTASRDVRRLLERRAAALVGRDRAAFLGVLAPDADGLRARQEQEFDHLAQVPLASWEYALTGLDRTGEGRATARVELRYRIAGYDTVPAVTGCLLDLVRARGRWHLAGERPRQAGAQEIWQQGPVSVVRGRKAIVLGAGQDRERLRAVADTAERAVDAVARAWPGEDGLKEVLLVPPGLSAMGALLGTPAAGYRGIAAVTTGASGGGRRTSADRVIVNPEAYGVLGAAGQQVVLTHETTHVATRTATTGSTPLWLSEGFADWVAYRESGRTPAQAAPELLRAVRRDGPPAALPRDGDFGFSADAQRLAGAYEGGWLACRMIAERSGERSLLAFYRAVGGHPGRDGAVENALARELGATPEEFTARWRAYLREELG